MGVGINMTVYMVVEAGAEDDLCHHSAFIYTSTPFTKVFRLRRASQTFYNREQTAMSRRGNKLPLQFTDYRRFGVTEDFVKYLLNIGALSTRPGQTGYEGAVEEAIKSRHHAVAEIIRNHIKDLEHAFAVDSQLRSRHVESIAQHAAALKKRQLEYAQFRRTTRIGY